MKKKYYEFRQNNSGGSFIQNEFVARSVVFEAVSTSEASQLAIDVGIYFNGCDTGEDCPCCGDRWGNYPDLIELPVKVGGWFGSKATFCKTINQWCQTTANEANCIVENKPAVILYTKDKSPKIFYKKLNNPKTI